MTSLTPLRGPASKDAAKVDPTPTNVAETLRQQAESSAPVVAQEDDDDEGEDDEDDEDDDKDQSKAKNKKKTKAKSKPASEAYDPLPARMAERARIKSILESDAGKLLPRAAAHIALNTSLPAEDAIGVLGGMQAEQILPKAVTLAARMSAEPKYEIGPEAPALADDNPLRTKTGADGSTVPANPTALAAAIIAAGKKRRGEV